MTQVVRFGIAGAGMIAGKNVKAIQDCDETEVVFVGARNKEKAAAFAEKFGVPDSGSLEDVCDSEGLDAVYFCVPTAVRMTWVLRAIKNGKHVLVEKPHGSKDEVRAMVDAAKQHGVIFMDGTMWMQSTRTAHLHQLLHEQKKIGPILHVHSAFTARFPKEGVQAGIRGQPDLEPAGGLADMGWYTVGAILFAFDFVMPNRVTCVSQHLDNGGLYQAAGRLEWADGRVAQFDAGYFLPLRQYVEIAGEKGMVRINDLVNSPANAIDSFMGPSIAKAESYWLMTNDSGVWLEGNGETVKVPDVPARHEVEMFSIFSKAVFSGKQNALWVKSSISTQLVIDALVRSVEQDGAYEIVEEVSLE